MDIWSLSHQTRGLKCIVLYFRTMVNVMASHLGQLFFVYVRVSVCECATGSVETHPVNIQNISIIFSYARTAETETETGTEIAAQGPA